MALMFLLGIQLLLNAKRKLRMEKENLLELWGCWLQWKK